MSELREARGLTQDDIGRLLGMQGDAYGKIERDVTRLKAADATKLADFYGITVAILVGNQSRAIPIVGYVDTVGEVYPLDDQEPKYQVFCPFGLDPRQTDAAEVRGNSMYPVIGEGWIVFYSRYSRVPTEAHNQTCIVKVANGATLLRHVRRGHGWNRFDLISLHAPQMDDVDLEWAAPIREWQSPRVADPQPIAA